jgi:hypothetical protein
MGFRFAANVEKRPHQCPTCMFFYASIDRCRGFREGGMNAMFSGETSDLCPKYRIADFEGTVKAVNDERKTAVFSMAELDSVFDGIPYFGVDSEAIREQLRSCIGGPPVSFSVRNGQVVEVNINTK